MLGTDSVGGTEVQMSYLANGIDRTKFDISIFILRSNYFSKNTNEKVNFNCLRKNLYDNRFFPKLSEFLFIYYLKKLRIDIMLINGAQKNINLAIICQKLIKKTIIAVRNIRFTHDPFFMSDMKKINKRKFEVICNSYPIKEQLIKMANFNKNLITVINNGIDSSIKIVRKRSNENEVFKIMFVGNLRQVKNPEFFVEVAKKLCNSKNLKIKFFIVGDGPMKREISNFIINNNLQNKIKILGKLSKNSVPYNKVDLVFNSSRSEGSSNSILESLSFGTPVVASKNSGNSFILKNKTFGRLFDLESINTAIEAIKYFYFLDQEKLSEISHEAINYIKNDYNKSKMIDGYSKYFTKAINV